MPQQRWYGSFWLKGEIDEDVLRMRNRGDLSYRIGNDAFGNSHDEGAPWSCRSGAAEVGRDAPSLVLTIDLAFVYLGTGVMIQFANYGLVHYTGPDEDLEFLGRARLTANCHARQWTSDLPCPLPAIQQYIA
jgi:hypothetical protein